MVRKFLSQTFLFPIYLQFFFLPHFYPHFPLQIFTRLILAYWKCKSRFIFAWKLFSLPEKKEKKHLWVILRFSVLVVNQHVDIRIIALSEADQSSRARDSLTKDVSRCGILSSFSSPNRNLLHQFSETCLKLPVVQTSLQAPDQLLNAEILGNAKQCWAMLSNAEQC